MNRHAMTRHAAASLLTGLTLALAGAPAAADANGRPGRLADFAQVDASSDSHTLVLVRALGDPRAADPAPLLAASASRWADGRAAALSLVARRTLAASDGVALRGGAGLGLERFDDRAGGERRDDASLRLQIEADGALAGQRVYLLAQASSFRRSHFVSAQLAPGARPLAFELSHYGDRGYDATTAVVRLRVAGGWWLRLGAVNDDSGTRALVGLAYNGF
jgi:hypothetical protein